MLLNMVSHANLAAEIDKVNKMSTDDRLIHARQRRQEQVQRWQDFDSEKTPEENHVGNGDVPNNKRLVKFGDSVTLLEAAARDDIEEVQILLEGKTDPNEANDDGLTALHQACIDNFEDMVQLLINFGASVNAVDSEQWTPLHAACTCGHTNIAKILVKNGADLMALNADHNMPYDICEDDETLDFVEKAMASRGITQQQINDTRSSREQQIITDMKTLLNEGKSIDFQDEAGATVLHVAAANGYVELARFLLLYNCKVNIQDVDGWTPLHAAACWSQLDIVEMLGAENADPTAKNTLGETPTDVTDDEEIKTLLAKIKSAMKDKKRRFLGGFRGFSSRNNSRRASGLRGQSFKGRSKRDKKAGISTIEAKSEAQFWIGNQGASDIKSPETPTENNNHIQNKTIPEGAPKEDPNNSIDPQSVQLDVVGEETLSKDQISNTVSPEINDKNQLVKEDRHCGSAPPNNGSSGQVVNNAGPPSNDSLKKKSKKGKKAPAPPTEITDKGEGENNVKNGSNLRIVMGSKKQYKLNDTVDGAVGNGKENGTGKTLAELKRRRAQETEEKFSHPPLDGAPPSQLYTYSTGVSESIKQFKGQPTSDLSDSMKSKKKFCIIL